MRARARFETSVRRVDVACPIRQSINCLLGTLVIAERTLAQNLRCGVRFLFRVGWNALRLRRRFQTDVLRLLSVVAGRGCESCERFRLLLCHVGVLRMRREQRHFFDVPDPLPKAC